MSGITDLTELLRSMSPQLMPGEWVFCTVHDEDQSTPDLKPLATFQEAEGLTLVLSKQVAEQANLPFEGVFKLITLSVHSSLHAVGLTAAVANCLTEQGISANVIAAYYHDHVFVPEEQAKAAMQALLSLTD